MSMENDIQALRAFKSQYGYLKKAGLQIHGLVEIDYDKGVNVIRVSYPFIFDRRLLPKTFRGLGIRGGANLEDLPDEFKINYNKWEWYKYQYPWQPEHFEAFISRAADEIRTSSATRT